MIKISNMADTDAEVPPPFAAKERMAMSSDQLTLFANIVEMILPLAT
jgi:hypothetical protein